MYELESFRGGSKPYEEQYHVIKTVLIGFLLEPQIMTGIKPSNDFPQRMDPHYNCATFQCNGSFLQIFALNNH